MDKYLYCRTLGVEDAVLDSLMNDEQIQDATVLAIQEPWARKTKDLLLTTPMYHHKWTKMVPSILEKAGGLCGAFSG